MIGFASKDTRCDEQGHGDTKHAVGDVEGGPVFSGPIDNVDEITDEAVVEDSVVEVSADSCGE